MTNSKKRVLDRLRSHTPPYEDIDLINVTTSDISKASNRIKKEIELMISNNSFKLICLVGTRGIGKSHIKEIFTQIYSKDDKFKNVRFLSLEMENSPINIVKSINKELGKSCFSEMGRKIRKKFGLMTDIDLFQKLSELIENDLLSLALIRFNNDKEKDLIWRWLTSRIGLREVNIVKVGKIRISRNLNDSDASSFLQSIAKIIFFCYGYNLIIFLDEFTFLLSYKPSERKAVKRFIVDLINRDWEKGLFLLLCCTPDVWTDLAENRYSEEVGLSRRLRKIDLTGITFEESLEIGERVLELYDQSIISQIRESMNFEEIVDELYVKNNKNTGYFIKDLVTFFDNFLYNTPDKGIVSEEQTELSELIEELKKEGKKLHD